MSIVIPTSYGHYLTIDPRDHGGVRLRISASMTCDGYSAHLNADQAQWLVGALPGEPVEVPQTPNDRGFYAYPQVTCVDGTVLRAQESSAATGPHLWLFQGDAGRAGSERSYLELDATACAGLKSAIKTWLDDIPNRWG